MHLSEQDYLELLEFFQPGQSVAICGHVNPDGDCLGSAVALGLFLEAHGCQVVKLLASGNTPPRRYNFLQGYHFSSVLDYQDSPDLFIAVDLSDIKRLGDAASVTKRAGQVLVIDHHQGYSGFADHALIDPDSAATGLLVWNLIKASGEKAEAEAEAEAVTADIASACYVAMMTDTGRFAYQNTGVDVFEAAASMVRAGADPALLNRLVYEERLESSLQLDALVINRLEYLDEEKKVVCSWVTSDDYRDLGVDRSDTENLSVILRSIQGVEVVILLREEGDLPHNRGVDQSSEGHDQMQAQEDDNGKLIRVNLRSKSDFDVGKLAASFGGGGHQGAAGYNFRGERSVVLSNLMPVLGNSGFSIL
ncbi:MAG: DHH family phosphoesterase [Coriobacteriales bacterium]|nr:DHH family phosphoesterase [Coriobacteriales bacterium]